MKVVIAGHQKTGTKSLTKALRIMDYNVYDFVENCFFLSKEWKEIFKNGGNAELFKKMFKNIDAVCDVPSFPFWREIHNAFPDSKIILSVRDNEDEWFRSICNQIKINSEHLFLNMIFLFSPSCLFNLAPIGSQSITLAYGCSPRKFNSKKKPNETILKMSYRKHNADVIQNAPKDKLLVYNCKEGWEPLCQFLGVEKPNVPFPHENKKASVFDEMFESNEIMVAMKREAFLVASLLLTGISIGVYIGLKYFDFV